MNLRAPLLLALCAPFAAACFQKLDDTAARDWNPTAAVEAPDGGGSGAPFPVNLTTPEIGQTADQSGEVTVTAASACDKVKADAHDIRQRVCSGCHEGASAQGAPLTFILDDAMLVNAKSTSSNNAGKTYVIPGDPDNSLLYRRAAIVQDMPPGSTDVRNASTSLSVSDFSVLRDWILNCTGAGSQPASTGTGGATGGTSTTGTGGGAGTAGAGGGTATGAGGSGGASGGADAGAGTGTGTGGTGATADAGGAGAGGAAGTGGFRRDNARFNFEQGVQGWAGVAGTGLATFTNVATSAAQAFAGQRSLAGTIASTAAADYDLEVQNPPNLAAGATITFHVMVPAGVASVQPYIFDAANVFTGTLVASPTPGAFSTITLTVPANAGAIARLGVQFHTADGTVDGIVYVDSINY